MDVEIPDRLDHQAAHKATFTIADTCPRCGGSRATVQWKVALYDGHNRMIVDIWTNPCGHVDLYTALRAEAAQIIRKKKEAEESAQNQQDHGSRTGKLPRVARSRKKVPSGKRV